MYKIILKNLKLNLPIGIYEFEKEKTQSVLINLECLSYSSYQFNNINDCIDYSKIFEFIKSFETKAHIELIEQLQLKIINFCFSFDENIYFIDLTIFKTDIIPDVQCGINMQFNKEDFLQLNLK